MNRLHLLLCLFLILLGCDQKKILEPSGFVMEGKTMGTSWKVSLTSDAKGDPSDLQEEIQQLLDQDDRELSTWKNDSVLSRFNQYSGGSPQAVSENMADIVTMALRIGRKTQGVMDITAGPLVNLWGFGPDKQPIRIPSQKDIDAAKAIIGLDHLRVIQTSDSQYLKKSIPELYVDLSTLGEGFATDHLARFLEEKGIQNYLVSVGGAVLARGHNPSGKPWRIAIQKPTDEERAVQAVVEPQGHGISTSGSYLNYYELNGERFSHIIDPRTGKPITHKLVSATVIAPTAMEADGWDTGLMVLGIERAKELALREKLAVYLITKEGDSFKSWMSPQFKAFIPTQ